MVSTSNNGGLLTRHWPYVNGALLPLSDHIDRVAS